MKLEKYTPAPNEVLFEEVREEKSSGGIYIPSADFILEEKKEFWGNTETKFDGSKVKLGEYRVIKAGTATPYLIDDVIVIRKGIQPEEIEFEEGTLKQVNMAYVIGYTRE